MEERISELFGEMVQWRRHLHENPEDSFKEYDTAAFIEAKLAEFGLDEVKRCTETGVVGLLKGTAGEGKCLALRADIDALPMEEENDCPYRSKRSGMAHTCGHDGHTAMLLATAKILSENRDKLRGSVKFIFQPGEETAPGGAIGMVKAGVMEDPKVDMVIGQHIFPDERCGAVRTAAGPMTIGGSTYVITIKGKGGHCALPHLAQDVVLAACEFVVLIQQAVSRCVNPKETGVVSICQIHAGTKYNVMPDQATLPVNYRYYTLETRDIIEKKIHDVAEAVEKMSGCSFEFAELAPYPPVINDPEAVALVERVCKEKLGIEFIEEGYTNGGDDFSQFLLATGTPGVYYGLLAGHETDEIYGIHNPKFNWNEEAMKTGVAIYVQSALDYLA